MERGETYETLQDRAAEKGGQSALIERFGIRRLYGYRTISLDSDFAATILIAKNGTGKTTLLGALDAFLRMQLYRLRNLEFEEIFCKLRGAEDEIVITHDELIDFLQVPQEGEVQRLAGRVGCAPEAVFEFVMTDFRSELNNYYGNSSDRTGIAGKILQTYGFDMNRAVKICSEIYESLFQRTAKMQDIRRTLDEILAGYEVVYLPTYRRVELALTDEVEDRRARKKQRPKISVASGSLYTGDIQFGLSDISDRLEELNRRIIIQSNSGYRKISENIINELITGFDVSSYTEIPQPEDLKLFFARLETGASSMGPYYPINTPDLSRVYSGEGVPEEHRKFLTYFLGKLNEIVDITKEIERPVEEFVNSCNKYLSSTEPSTHIEDFDRDTHLESFDVKALRMNRSNLSVYVESIPGRSPIDLDALSSGEKQMISLLAKLYLYPKKKIVLIDEPELSLSIDWQRGILVDVLLSPQCEQVIAITHSPFVFDNALEAYARSLILKIERNPEPILTLEDRALFDSGVDGDV